MKKTRLVSIIYERRKILHSGCLSKFRCFGSVGFQTYATRRGSSLQNERKESVMKGPRETLVKALRKEVSGTLGFFEHPALHGITVKENAREFKNLGLRNDLCSALAALNLHQPTTIQEMSIPRILDRKSILCTSQTGSGKTLAYLLPMLHLLKNEEELNGIFSRPRRPRAFVVAPFRELAIQVLGVVKYLSHFTRLKSLGLISGRKKKWVREGLHGSVDVLVATPHVLLEYLKRDEVHLTDLSHLVVDECDTMFDASFISAAIEILKSSGLASKYHQEAERHWGNVQTTFVTTTVSRDMLKTLNTMIPDLHVCDSNLHKVLPHITQKFIKVPQHKKSELLLETIRRELSRAGGQTMVFCNTTKSCDWTSYFLQEEGIPQIRLHGDISKKERRIHLKSFQEKTTPVLVCTDIASRGLDTTNVSHVINFDFPLSVVDYMHRAGRTGRLGTSLPCHVTSFVSHNRELVTMEKIKKAMQFNTALEDASLWQTSHRPRNKNK